MSQFTGQIQYFQDYKLRICFSFQLQKFMSFQTKQQSFVHLLQKKHSYESEDVTSS